jgi:Na+/H+-dicarboxylate symporter
VSTQTSTPSPAGKTGFQLPKWAGSFGFQIIAALIVGLGLGLLAKYTGSTKANPNGLGATLQTIGSSYVSLLQTAVVPLIFTAVVSSISNLRQVSNAARLAWNTLLWFAITSLIAVLIGMGLGVLLQPGANTGISGEAKYTGKSGDWWAFLVGLFPKNFLGLGASSTVGDSGAVTTSISFNVLQILVIAIAVGVAALKVGKAAEPFLNLNASALAVIQKVLWWIIRIAGLSIKQYFSGVWPAVQLAFVSRSSVGTLPLTQRVTERSLGVPRAYASFAVPLGATTKMDGCAAIYPAVSAIFVAQFFGIHLDFSQYLLIALVSVLGSAATAGTTGAVVMLTLTLSTLGLPLAGVGLLLAIDPILDMGRTAVNVAGQALVPTIVAKRQGILDESLYNAPRNGTPFVDDSATDEAATDGTTADTAPRELQDAKA